jgi:hypothetical protein
MVRKFCETFTIGLGTFDISCKVIDFRPMSIGKMFDSVFSG